MCAKKNIKAVILQQSLDLFNSYSWSAISLRKVAAALKISDGNLRYHFKTKEDIVLSLFGQMTAEMAEVILSAGQTVEDLVPNFERMFRIMYRYRFLFIEAYFIRRAYESYGILFTQLQESRKSLFMDAFQRLKREGILTDTFSDAQYELLFEQLFVISDSWLKYVDADVPMEEVEAQINHYAQLCFGLIRPYMADRFP